MNDESETIKDMKKINNMKDKTKENKQLSRKTESSQEPKEIHKKLSFLRGGQENIREQDALKKKGAL